MQFAEAFWSRGEGDTAQYWWPEIERVHLHPAATMATIWEQNIKINRVNIPQNVANVQKATFTT